METLQLDRIQVSKTNPRKHFDEKALAELTESVKKLGILQPVLVRNVNSHYELVAGERRLRAAKAAGLKDIPAIVKVLSDKEALEVQVVENLQRTDLHPMEEAEGYERLTKDHGYGVEELAAKVGKSKAYIYARLKLTALCKEARKAFYDGELNPSTALLIARIPDPKLQERALGEITDDNYGDGPMSYRNAAQHIQDEYMLRLAEAPFDVKDAQLVAAAGACVTCPFRTGNQKELFPDVKSADVCTKPSCFNQKRQVSSERALAAAKAKGTEVITGPKAKKALGYGSDYVKVSDMCHEDPRARNYQTLLRNVDVPRVIAQDEQGTVHELIKKSDAVQGLKQSGHIFAKRTTMDSTGNEKWREDQRRAAAKAKLDAQVHRKILAEIATKATLGELSDMETLRILAGATAEHTWHDAKRFVANRRDPSVKSSMTDGAITRMIKEAKTGDELLGLLIELLISRDLLGWSRKQFASQLMKQWGIDRAKIEKFVRAEKKPAKTNG